MSTVSTVIPIILLNASAAAGESLPVASPKARKPRVWTVFVTLFLAIVAGQVATRFGFGLVDFVIGFLAGIQKTEGTALQTSITQFFQQPLVFLLMVLLPFQFGMLAVVVWAARRSKQPLKERLGLLPQSGRKVGSVKLLTMAGFTFSAAIASNIVMSLLMGPPPAGGAINNAIANTSWWSITLLSIILSVIPGVFEEIVFRGFLQRRFLQRWSPAVAIGVTSLLFALMHSDSVQHIIAVVPLAVVTGLLAYRTDSVKPGMLVHAVHNVMAVGIAGLATLLTPHFGQEVVSLVALGAIGSLGLVGLPAVISLLRRAKPLPATAAAIDLKPAASEEPVVSLSVLSRGLSQPAFAIDSRLAS